MKAPEKGQDPKFDEMADKAWVAIRAAQETHNQNLTEEEVRDTIYRRLVQFGAYPITEGASS